jgi:hypothetical protein
MSRKTNKNENGNKDGGVAVAEAAGATIAASIASDPLFQHTSELLKTMEQQKAEAITKLREKRASAIKEHDEKVKQMEEQREQMEETFEESLSTIDTHLDSLGEQQQSRRGGRPKGSKNKIGGRGGRPKGSKNKIAGRVGRPKGTGRIGRPPGSKNKAKGDGDGAVSRGGRRGGVLRNGRRVDVTGEIRKYVTQHGRRGKGLQRADVYTGVRKLGLTNIDVSSGLQANVRSGNIKRTGKRRDFWYRPV